MKTWNIGIIDLTRIFPSYLKARMAKEQKEKHWAPQFNPALGEALKKVNDLEKLGGVLKCYCIILKKNNILFFYIYIFFLITLRNLNF